MPEELTEMLAEVGLRSDGFEGVLGVVESLREAQLPPLQPSPELAALLAVPDKEPLPPPSRSAELVATFAAGPVSAPLAGVVPHRRRRAGLVVGAVLLGLGGTTAAAAANVLPERMQEVVADFSDTFLPFQLPHPADRGEQRGEPQLEVPPEEPVLSPADQGDERSPRTPGLGERGPSDGPGAPVRSLPSSSPSVPVSEAPGTNKPPIAPAPSTTEPGGKPGTPPAPVPSQQPGGQPAGGPAKGPGGAGPGGSAPEPVTAPGGNDGPGDGGTTPVDPPGTSPPDRGLVGGVVGMALTVPFSLLGA